MTKSKSYKSSGFHVNKFILLIVVLLISLGLYLYGNKTNSLNTTNAPVVNNFDTSRWLTFTSEIYPTQSTGINPVKPLPAKTQFTIKYPKGWKVIESNNNGTFLELTRDDRILNVGTFGFPQSCEAGLTIVKDFQSQIGVLRRVINENQSEVMSGRKNFIICSNEPGYKISGFGTHTSLGYITFDVLISTTNSDLEEMDQIISTIQKVK